MEMCQRYMKLETAGRAGNLNSSNLLYKRYGDSHIDSLGLCGGIFVARQLPEALTVKHFIDRRILIYEIDQILTAVRQQIINLTWSVSVAIYPQAQAGSWFGRIEGFLIRYLSQHFQS